LAAIDESAKIMHENISKFIIWNAECFLISSTETLPMELSISRRNLLKGACHSMTVVMLAPLAANTATAAKPALKLRIVPIAGKNYPVSFLKFAERARFDSVRDAIASVRDPSMAFNISPALPKISTTPQFSQFSNRATCV
jgi:hypothetical protein